MEERNQQGNEEAGKQAERKAYQMVQKRKFQLKLVLALCFSIASGYFTTSVIGHLVIVLLSFANESLSALILLDELEKP